MVLTLVLAAGFHTAAFADDAAPAPPPSANSEEAVSMQGYGVKMPDCLEWTDACRVCKRDSAGNAQCSTPGIACLPTTIICRAPSKP